jgi:hypothetical protein
MLTKGFITAKAQRAQVLPSGLEALRAGSGAGGCVLSETGGEKVIQQVQILEL